MGEAREISFWGEGRPVTIGFLLLFVLLTVLVVFGVVSPGVGSLVIPVLVLVRYLIFQLLKH